VFKATFKNISVISWQWGLLKIMLNCGDLKLKQKCQRLYCEKISNYEHYKFHRKVHNSIWFLSFIKTYIVFGYTSM
jgi:hypothetical protein